jgi:hypothetical protein
VLGQPTDVKTEPGAYDGYEVIKGCPKSLAQYAVRGLGKPPSAPSTGQRLCDAVREPAVFGCGGEGGIACTVIGPHLDVLDWRAVDAIIEQLGRYEKENGLTVEVGIHVYPPPLE